MTTKGSFTYDIERSRDEGLGINVTTVICHGRLVSDNSGEIKNLIKPMIDEGHGGHIRIDLGDLGYLDSSGLGALVGLKVSALNKGLCRLELVNLTQRVKDLLSLANLTKLFSS